MTLIGTLPENGLGNTMTRKGIGSMNRIMIEGGRIMIAGEGMMRVMSENTIGRMIGNGGRKGQHQVLVAGKVSGPLPIDGAVKVLGRVDFPFVGGDVSYYKLVHIHQRIGSSA
jgi:hypothetical protein